MQTSSVLSQTKSQPLPTAATAANGQLTGGDFMKLLISQVQHQDPLQPMTNAEFATQMAQFSTLQSIDELNSNFAQMLLLQNLTQGANLVGKNVVYQPTGETSTSQGIVQSVSLQNGQLLLQIGGQHVPLNQVQQITQPVAATTN
jgi:flagellar basal-body rod modification protein FlgD